MKGNMMIITYLGKRDVEWQILVVQKENPKKSGGKGELTFSTSIQDKICSNFPTHYNYNTRVVLSTASWFEFLIAKY